MPLTLEVTIPAHVETRTIKNGERDVALDHSVDAVTFVDDDNVFCGSDDHTLSLWNVATNTRRHVFIAKTHGAECVAVDVDGIHAVSGHGSWGGVCLWNLETGALVHQLDETLMYVSAVGFFQPRVGDREVIAHVGGGLFRWSIVTGAAVKAPDHGGKKHPTAFTSTSVLRALPKSTTLSALPGEKKLRDFDAVARAQCAAFSRDGKFAGVGGDNGAVRVVDVESGAVVFANEGAGEFKDTIKAIALDGSRVAVGTQGGAVIAARFAGDGLGRDVTAVDKMSIRSLAFSPSGKRLAVGCYDGTVRVFRV